MGSKPGGSIELSFGGIAAAAASAKSAKDSEYIREVSRDCPSGDLANTTSDDTFEVKEEGRGYCPEML